MAGDDMLRKKLDALDGDRDRFIDEVTRLVVGYLRPGKAERLMFLAPARGRG